MGLPSSSFGSRLGLNEGKDPKQHDAICHARKPEHRVPLEME